VLTRIQSLVFGQEMVRLMYQNVMGESTDERKILCFGAGTRVVGRATDREDSRGFRVGVVQGPRVIKWKIEAEPSLIDPVDIVRAAFGQSSR
jgi:hypothetical protein